MVVGMVVQSQTIAQKLLHDAVVHLEEPFGSGGGAARLAALLDTLLTGGKARNCNSVFDSRGLRHCVVFLRVEILNGPQLINQFSGQKSSISGGSRI